MSLSKIDKNTLPSIAVIVPNYNYSKWIGEALRSVDEQDYSGRKFLVVIDDGSTDNSWDVIKLNCNLKVPQGHILGQKNICYTGEIGSTPVIAYKFEKSGGPSRARNLAIKLAWQNAQIFSMLDADDVMLQGKLTKCVNKILEDCEYIGGVYTDYETFNEETGAVIREYKESFSRDGLLRSCMVHSGCTLTKNCLVKSGLYDEELRVAEDWDEWLRITEHFVILHIPEKLVRVRVHCSNATNSVGGEVWQNCWKRVVEKTQQRMLKDNQIKT